MAVETDRRRFLALAKTAALGGAAGLLGGAIAWRSFDRDVFSLADFSRQEYLSAALSAYGESGNYFCAAGALAASYLNSQPWAFQVSDGQILVFADLARWTGAADPTARQLFMSVGCAIRTIEIAAGAHGVQARTSIVLDEQAVDLKTGELVLVAQIDLVPGAPGQEARKLSPLLASRRTNRHAHDLGHGISETGIQWLQKAGDTDLTRLLLVPHTQRRHTEFAKLLGQAAKYRAADNAYTNDAGRWFRCMEADLLEKRDGENLDSLGISPIYLPMWKFWRCPSPRTVADFRAEIVVERAPYSNFLGALMLPERDNSMRSIVAAGRIWQELCLIAARIPLSVHPVSALSEYFLTPGHDEAKRARASFTKDVSRMPGWKPVLAFRMGRATGDAASLPRREPDSVILTG